MPPPRSSRQVPLERQPLLRWCPPLATNEAVQGLSMLQTDSCLPLPLFIENHLDISAQYHSDGVVTLNKGTLAGCSVVCATASRSHSHLNQLTGACSQFPSLLPFKRRHYEPGRLCNSCKGRKDAHVSVPGMAQRHSDSCVPQGWYRIEWSALFGVRFTVPSRVRQAGQTHLRIKLNQDSDVTFWLRLSKRQTQAQGRKREPKQRPGRFPN